MTAFMLGMGWKSFMGEDSKNSSSSTISPSGMSCLMICLILGVSQLFNSCALVLFSSSACSSDIYCSRSSMSILPSLLSLLVWYCCLPPVLKRLLLLFSSFLSSWFWMIFFTLLM